MMSHLTRVAVVVAAALVSGCGVGYKDLPLPGSKVRGDVYSVSAEFDQALNLAQGAQVKLNGISIGRVTSVAAQNYRAHVTMDLRATTPVPDDSTARLRYDTPLGELIIQVMPGHSPRTLTDGGTFAETSTAPSVEDALQSASTLINGGNLGELQVLATELNAAFGGREREIRDSTRQLTDFLTQANASDQDIAAALDSLSRASVTLNQHRQTIRNAVHDIGPAAKTLGKDTDELVAVLKNASRVAVRAGRIAEKVDDPLLQILTELGPIADAIVGTRSLLRIGLDLLIEVARQIDKTVPSDTLPLFTVLHLGQTQIVPTSASAAPASGKSTSGVTPAVTDPVTGLVRGVTDPVLAPVDPLVQESTRSLLKDLGNLLGGQR